MVRHDDIELTAKYGAVLRDCVNAVVQPVAQKSSPHEVLGLKDGIEWGVLCVALDVIGDTSSALANFMRFGLDGPTRYEDAGERYLRLYGMLNATYLQQDSVQKVCNLLSHPEAGRLKERLRSLKVRELRNKVGSHSVEHRAHRGAIAKAYAPIYMNLGGFACSVTEQRGDATESFDLKSVVQEHCGAVMDGMDAACLKVLERLPAKPKRRREEMQEKLSDLRFMRGGGIVVPGTGTAKSMRISIVGVAPDPQDAAKK